jgi:hypothetical protein
MKRLRARSSFIFNVLETEEEKGDEVTEASGNFVRMDCGFSAGGPDSPDDITKSLVIAIDYNNLSEAGKSMIDLNMKVVTIPENTDIQQKGGESDAVIIIVSRGMAVQDPDVGEWYSRGKMFNVESLAFDQNVNYRSLRTGPEPVKCVYLYRHVYPRLEEVRLLYYKTKFPILSTIRDKYLKKIKLVHVWVEAGSALDITGRMSLITHGAADSTDSGRVFTGKILGIKSLMTGERCVLRAETFMGVAFLGKNDFNKFLRERSFLSAVNEITFTRSVEEEHSHTDSLIRGSSGISENIRDTVKVKEVEIVNGDRIQIGNYTVKKKIGKGATSTVLEAFLGETPYVLKVVPITKKHFADREIEILSKTDSKYIIHLYEVLITSSLTVLVEEMASWGSLLGVVLNLVDTRKCASSVVQGLLHLYDIGYGHGDIKPANILRCSDGSFKLADMGCGFSLSSLPDYPVGTPAFMAPETLDGKPCDVSDVWSLGATVFCVMYGKVPFRDEGSQSLRDAVFFSDLKFGTLGTSDAEVSARNFCEITMTKDFRKRPRLEDLEKHDLIRNFL